MSDVRALYRSDRDGLSRFPSDGAPRGSGRESISQQSELLGFMEMAGIRDITLDTMTQAERVYLEIDMQARSRRMFTSDYDPLP